MGALIADFSYDLCDFSFPVWEVKELVSEESVCMCDKEREFVHECTPACFNAISAQDYRILI